jgi:hypothetical protein
MAAKERDNGSHLLSFDSSPRLVMHLYLGENPRTLYLVTSSQEENNGRPRRALVFRAAEDNPYQAIVEFLPKDQVNLRIRCA